MIYRFDIFLSNTFIIKQMSWIISNSFLTELPLISQNIRINIHFLHSHILYFFFRSSFFLFLTEFTKFTINMHMSSIIMGLFILHVFDIENVELVFMVIFIFRNA